MLHPRLQSCGRRFTCFCFQEGEIPQSDLKSEDLTVDLFYSQQVYYEFRNFTKTDSENTE